MPFKKKLFAILLSPRVDAAVLGLICCQHATAAECFQTRGFLAQTHYALWTTRHGVANAMEASWLPTNRTGGEAQSPPSALCGRLLSDKRSRTTPDLSHVLLVAWRATQNRDVCLFELVWMRRHLWLGKFCARLHHRNMCLSSYAVLVWSVSLSYARVWKHVLGWKRGAVSLCVGVSGLGQGFLVL